MIEYRDYQKEYIRKVVDGFKAGYKRLCVVAPCGSGKTALFAGMAAAAQKNGKCVWFLVHRRELMQQTIDTFKRFDIPLDTIHIGMVGTCANKLESLPKPDMIVFDECHFSAARTWQRVLEAYPDAYLIGLTATPARLDGKPLGDIYQTMIECITVRQLIEQRYLAPYVYYAPSVADLSTVKRKGSDYDTDTAAEILSQRAVFGDVVTHYRRYADGKQAICYCANIRHSQKMAAYFTDNGINAVHFDGNTPKRERDRIIADFRAGNIKILCNVDLISVGFDCPDCECCILLRPTMSTALFIQQAMRCMRPKDGKTAIILDHVNNYERHGLPDEEREWSLDKKLKPRKQHADDGTLTVRMCKNCFGTFMGRLNVCPYCGAEYKLTQAEIKAIKEVHLAEVKERVRHKAEEKVKDLEDPDKCTSMSQLIAYAKKKGYKTGWAYYQARKRGIITR